ncbi:MAG: DHA2 family efflux MFS transporter permease subunit, partial [Caulobacteraceae bacterium]
VMAVWVAAVILGPIFGPILGGWITDNFTWRWCFYINVPIGILATAGILLFMSGKRSGQARPFDFLGFGALTGFVGSFQLIVDRGPSQDWFSSTEIQIYGVIAAISFWIFLVQTLTAKHPFFDRALAKDRNFITSTVFGFAIGIVLFATMALLPPMTQQLMGYSAFESGVVLMPRGIGSFISMFIVGRLIGKIDTRLILLSGLALCTFAMWQMSHFSLLMGNMPIITSGLIQGLGIGLIFVPLSTIAYATLAARLRPDGTAIYTLVRNLGSSIGISIMQALWTSNTAVAHATLASKLSLANPVDRATLGPMLHPGRGMDVLNGEITRQSAMVAYVDDFRLMMIGFLVMLPLLAIMQTPKLTSGVVDAVAE